MWKMIKLAIFILIVLGLIFTFQWHIGFLYDWPIGSFPGDIHFNIGHVRIFLPFTTSILFSVAIRFIIEVIFRRG